MPEEERPGTMGAETFTPEEEMDMTTPATPEDAPEEKGEGDEWVTTGKTPDEEKGSEN